MTRLEATRCGCGHERRSPHLEPAIFMGDLARARNALQITDPATSAAVMGLLGFDGSEQPEPPRPGSTPDPEPGVGADPLRALAPRARHLPVQVSSADFGIPARKRGSEWNGRRTDEPAGDAAGEATDATDATDESSVPTRPSKWFPVTFDEVAPGPSGWWNGEMSFPGGTGGRYEPPVPGGRSEAAATTSGSGVPPLFRTRVARHILGAALSVPVAEGDIDMNAVTDMVATRKFVGTIPRKRLFTTRFGAQVLLDVGPGMQPFYTDVVRLPQTLESIIGPGLEVLRFDTFPLDGAGPRGRPWPDYRPPRAGTPVLVVTGFGIGGTGAPPPASIARWAAFVHMLNRAGCRPLALVPGPAGRVDPSLAELMTVVPWDRTVTVGAVRDLVPVGAG